MRPICPALAGDIHIAQTAELWPSATEDFITDAFRLFSILDPSDGLSDCSLRNISTMAPRTDPTAITTATEGSNRTTAPESDHEACAEGAGMGWKCLSNNGVETDYSGVAKKSGHGTE